jgi:hypothetical protein
MTKPGEPWLPVVPGQALRAQDWNHLQVLIGVELQRLQARIASLEAELRHSPEALHQRARQLSEQAYFANRRSREIHHRDCPYAPRISASNRYPEDGFLDGNGVAELILRGFNGCRTCLSAFDRDRRLPKT